jgi:hypothetical protein
MGEYSETEVTGAALWGRFLDSRDELGNEFNRISDDPAAFDLVSEAFENVN